MNTLKATIAALIVTAPTGLVAVPAHAAQPALTKMPDVLINEWCSDAVTPPEKTKDGVKTSYVLPSWTPDGHCTNILAITPWDFWSQDNSLSCLPTKVHTKQDVAPSGTAYDISISAVCFNNNQQKTIKTFRFVRYKGSMSVTTGTKQ